MQRHYLMALVILSGVMSTGCAPTARPPVSAPTPSVPDPIPSEALATTYLRFSPGIYRYQFNQTARIQGDGASDTLPLSITTRALIEAAVSIQPDSSISVTVSFDSIAIHAEGSILPHRPGQPVVLDSVMHGAFSPAGVHIDVHLADSLCAYSQFIAVARELMLPELGFETPRSNGRNFTDTTSHRSCRAGASIQMTTTRELRGSKRNPGEMETQQRTQVYGTGLLRRDSITVDGSISTHGKIFFTTLNRLPTLIQTESEGTITIQLGSTRSIFRQHSKQQIELLDAGH